MRTLVIKNNLSQILERFNCKITEVKYPKIDGLNVAGFYSSRRNEIVWNGDFEVLFHEIGHLIYHQEICSESYYQKDSEIFATSLENFYELNFPRESFEDYLALVELAEEEIESSSFYSEYYSKEEWNRQFSNIDLAIFLQEHVEMFKEIKS